MTMQDQPDAREIVEAVRAFIQDVVMTKLEGRDAFHARVAVNALGIVARELDIAPAANTAELERLRTLLERDGTLDDLNRELCVRIRSGGITLDTPGLREHLWQTTLAKLAVDQPKYASYRRATERLGKHP